MSKLHATPDGIVIENAGKFLLPRRALAWDDLFAQADPNAAIDAALADAHPVAPPSRWRAPVQNQEIWAAGVTYFRSRTARMEESKESGGGSFYDKVYRAERP